MSEPSRHSVAAAVMVRNAEGNMLLIKGLRRGWEPPGGIVELGESIRDGAIREVKEEAGIDVEITKFCGVFQSVSKGVVATMWLGRAIGGELTTSEESLEVGFFTVEQAKELITHPYFHEWLAFALDESKHPFFAEW